MCSDLNARIIQPYHIVIKDIINVEFIQNFGSYNTSQMRAIGPYQDSM
jgi:hypothetical protein